MKRRAALVWLILFSAYAATLGLHAFGKSDYAGDEPHYLLAAQSLVEDGDLNVENQYSLRSYDSFYPYALEPHGTPQNGMLNEPHGVGMPVLIAPAFWVGGAKGVEIFIAAIAALALALAYLLAVRVSPDPWALGGTLAVGLSPPLLAYGTAVYPEVPAAACLAGAALLALRLREAPTRPAAFGCFALLGVLPWLGTKLILPGAVIGAYAFWSLRNQRHNMLAVLSAELGAFSVALWVGINEGVYGGVTPDAAGFPGEASTGASSVGDYLGRAYRLLAMFIDREYGLIRWAPGFALAFYGVWLLWRGRRDRLSAGLPGYAEMERCGLLCAGVFAVQVVAAAFLERSIFGFWFPGRHLLPALPLVVPLVALGFRHVPRTGLVLAALTLAASVWLYVDVRSGGGGLVVGRPHAPWGPLEKAWPYFGGGTASNAATAALGAAVAALVLWELRRARASSADAAVEHQPHLRDLSA